MKQEIPIRITVVKPVAGVTMQVQKGRDELIPPVSTSKDAACSLLGGWAVGKVR